MSRLYKGRYLIALYDREDDLIAVLDNAGQMSEWLGIERERAWVILYYIGKGRRYVISHGKRCYIHLIDTEGEE